MPISSSSLTPVPYPNATHLQPLEERVLRCSEKVPSHRVRCCTQQPSLLLLLHPKALKPPSWIPLDTYQRLFLTCRPESDESDVSSTPAVPTHFPAMGYHHRHRHHHHAPISNIANCTADPATALASWFLPRQAHRQTRQIHPLSQHRP